MGYTALERLFETERVRQRAVLDGGFGVPVMHEHGMPSASAPYLVTGASGKFLPTRRTADGMVRCGLFPCSVADEDAVVNRMVESLLRLGIPRCTSVQDVAPDFRPRHLLVPVSMVGSAGADVQKASEIMHLQGNVGVLDGIQIVVTGAEVPLLLVSVSAGIYIRSGDHLGLILAAVDRKFMLVGHEMA